MPAIDANKNRPRAAERVIRRKKRERPRGQQGPISSTSHSQPGIITDREMEVIEKRKRKPKQRKALRAARVHGPKTGRGTRPGEDKSVTPAQQRAIDRVVRDTRIRVLRSRDRSPNVSKILRSLAGNPTTSELLRSGASGRTANRVVTRELEGRGALAATLGAAGNLTASAQRLNPGRPSESRLTERKPLGGTQVAENLAKDIVNLPAQALPSLYQPTAGLVEAVKGDPERLKRVAKSFNEGDPVFNAAAAAIAAAGGDEQAALDRLRRARDAALEHPGLTLAEAFGVAKGTSYGVGAVARSPVSPKVIRRAAATTGREPRTLPGTKLVQHREYSRDPVVKAAQVAADKRRARRHPETAGRISDREIRRRVDEAVAVSDELARNRPGGHDVEPLAGDAVAQTLKDFGVKSVHDLPKVAADRLARHEESRHQGAPALKVINRQFRETVLSTSPKWLAGNIIEGLGRAALNRAGPRSYATGRKVLKRLEQITPDQAESAMARMVGGGHMASVKRQRVELGPDYWSGSNLAPVANALGKFWRKPGPKQAAGLWHGWTELVFRQINGRIETAIQTAHLGRELRRSELMDSSIIKLGDRAIEQAAQGLKATEQQVRFGRKVDQAYGRYSKLSPAERHWISTYTPFIRWYLNSIDFVVRTLPRDHPIVLAAIASAEMATDEWRQQEGLDKFVEGALPDWLQGSIPTEGGHQRISQFGPFGAFSDFTGTTAGQLTPVFSGVASALSGEKWTGAPLTVRGEDGKMRPANEIERILFGTHEFLKSTIPGLSVGERIEDQGPRVLDPFRDVKSKEPKTRRKSARSSSSDGKFFADRDGEFFDEDRDGKFFKERGAEFFDEERGGRFFDERSAKFFRKPKGRKFFD